MQSGGVILVGHGRFAEGLLTPLQMLAGVPEYFAGIEFPAGMAEDELEEKILRQLEAFGGRGVLILTDVAGGTPFKMAVKASFGREDVTVVTGTNLPVVLQLAMLPEWTGVPESLEELVAAGREGLKVVRY